MLCFLCFVICLAVASCTEKRDLDCNGTNGLPSSPAASTSSKFVVLQPDVNPGGHEGFENEFEYGGDVKAAQRDFDNMFRRFKKEVLAAFPELSADNIRKKGWSFEATEKSCPEGGGASKRKCR